MGEFLADGLSVTPGLSINGTPDLNLQPQPPGQPQTQEPEQPPQQEQPPPEAPASMQPPDGTFTGTFRASPSIMARIMADTAASDVDTEPSDHDFVDDLYV